MRHVRLLWESWDRSPWLALLLALLAPLAITACSRLPPPATPAPAGAGRAAGLRCEEVPNLAPLLKPASTLLLGELHGTAEAPRFAQDAACLALRAGIPVSLGLEIPREEGPILDAFLASPGRPEDRAALLASPFWSDGYQDGRRSQAQLALLDQVRVWRREGRPIRVVPFDRTAKPSSNQERDRWLAEEMKAAIGAHPGDLFLGLAGNLHTRIRRGIPWDARYEPAGMLLVESLPQRPTVALDLAYTPGTAWTCLSPDPASCQVRAVKVNSDLQGRQVVLYPEIKNGYSGMYCAGPLTASPPAKAAGTPASPLTGRK